MEPRKQLQLRLQSAINRQVHASSSALVARCRAILRPKICVPFAITLTAIDPEAMERPAKSKNPAHVPWLLLTLLCVVSGIKAQCAVQQHNSATFAPPA